MKKDWALNCELWALEHWVKMEMICWCLDGDGLAGIWISYLAWMCCFNLVYAASRQLSEKVLLLICLMSYGTMSWTTTEFGTSLARVISHLD